MFINPAQIQILYNLALGVVLWATAIRIGLTIAPGEIVGSLRKGRALTRALVLNLVIVPAMVWGLTRLFAVDAETSIGLLLLAAAAGGPFGLTASQLANGNAAFALLLVSVLQASRVVTIPLWLGVFTPFDAQAFFGVFVTLALYILLPLLIGFGLQRVLRHRTGKWENFSKRIANLALGVLIVSAIWLSAEPLRALLVSQTMLLILFIQAASFGLGYGFGGSNTGERRTIAVMTMVRSSAVALLIAGQVYATLPGTSATVIAYGVTALVTSTCAALGLAHLQRTIFQKTDSTQPE